MNIHYPIKNKNNKLNDPAQGILLPHPLANII